MYHYYQFWHSFFHPASLMERLEKEEPMKGYKGRVYSLLAFILLFFVARSIWGVGTESITYVFAQNFVEEYIVLRYVAIGLALLFGLLFFVFHYYLFAYLLYFLTDIPFKTIRRVQLFVIAILLAEKFILFGVFYSMGYTTNLSFLSFAPIVATYLENEIVIFAVNQLSIGVIASIVVQYIFLSKHENVENKWSLLGKIIFLHVFFAVIIGILSNFPLVDWLLKGVTS